MENQDVIVPNDYPREGIPSAPHAYYVYFIYCAGRVKIGRAVDVRKRVSHIATGSPFKPVVILTVSGSLSAEAELHHRFEADRVHREWFRLSGPLRRYITGRLNDHGKAAFRKAEDEFLQSFLPIEDAPRTLKKLPKRCSHGNPLSRSCSKCTKEADMRVYDALLKKMQAEDY